MPMHNDHRIAGAARPETSRSREPERRDIAAATKREESATQERELRELALVTLFAAYCIPDTQMAAVEKLMNDEPLSHTERGWMIAAKIRLLTDMVFCVEEDYRIAAKYYMSYSASSSRFQWIDGGRLYRSLGIRTEGAMRTANEPRIRTLLRTMVDRVESLAPPATELYATRLAMPGRTCEEIARILDVVDEKEVSARLEAVASREKALPSSEGRLDECWRFWRWERSQGDERDEDA